MKPNLLFVLFFVWSFISCDSALKKNQEQIKQLDTEILKIHDEAMPKIGKVLSLRKQVYGKIDSCDHKGWKDSLQAVGYSLSKADQDMMDWMHHYEVPQMNDTALAYLQRQLNIISDVKNEVFDGINKAEQTLIQYQLYQNNKHHDEN